MILAENHPRRTRDRKGPKQMFALLLLAFGIESPPPGQYTILEESDFRGNRFVEQMFDKKG